MNELSDYLAVQDYLLAGSIGNWWLELPSGYDSFPKEDFFVALHEVYMGNPRFKGSFEWRAAACQDICSAEEASQGVLHAKIRANLVKIEDATTRFEVYYTFREAMKGIFGDSTGNKVFPFATAFLTWEENGIIDAELVRNLIVSAGVIFAIIAALIPYPKIAVLVGVNICAAIVEIVGLSHYWGVTMNGVSTIYFLICVGLSVDYSVHIAHAFVNSEGESDQRAISALGRIGPSTFNAVVSTIFAVILLASSESFVFEVFFKVLCLVSLVAGAHGLWLLPCLLGLLGDNPKGIELETPAKRHHSFKEEVFIEGTLEVTEKEQQQLHEQPIVSVELQGLPVEAAQGA